MGAASTASKALSLLRDSGFTALAGHVLLVIIHAEHHSKQVRCLLHIHGCLLMVPSRILPSLMGLHSFCLN